MKKGGRLVGKNRAYPFRERKRIIQHFEPGAPTDVPSNVIYRLGKIHDLGLLKGEWLDCGCADGGYAVAMIDLGVEKVIGVDAVEKRIMQARNREQFHPAVKFLYASAEELPFVDAFFDGVLLNEVLEHVTDEVKALREIYRVLRPGGHLVIMSPNRWFPFEGHGMHIGQHRVRFPIPLLPWLPSRISERFMCARNYWPHELRNTVCNEGFVIGTLDFVLPVFEVFPWLPHSIIRLYRKLIPVIEKIPLVRCFGVSIFIVAQKQ